jgi:hypothetical protein
MMLTHRIVKSLVGECGGSKQPSKKKPAKKKSAKKKTTPEELLDPPGLGKSLSPEVAQKFRDLRKLKVSTYSKSSKGDKK